MSAAQLQACSRWVCPCWFPLPKPAAGCDGFFSLCVRARSGLALLCAPCLLTGHGFSCLADTKYMNANDNIDGAASWLMCSVGTAKRLGIPEEKWVYQHSGAHCHEGTEQVIFHHRHGMLAEITTLTACLTLLTRPL